MSQRSWSELAAGAIPIYGHQQSVHIFNDTSFVGHEKYLEECHNRRCRPSTDEDGIRVRLLY